MTDFSKPLEVDDMTLAFPASVIGTLIPKQADLPEEYQKNWHRNKWCNLASSLLFKGGDFTVLPTIDKEMAVRHLQAVLGSYQPKHEHKIGAAGYLLALWNGEE